MRSCCYVTETLTQLVIKVNKGSRLKQGNNHLTSTSEVKQEWLYILNDEQFFY